MTMITPLDPSIRMPMRPRTYGGVHTVTLNAPPTAVAASLSRFDCFAGFAPIRRDGTAT